MFGFSPENFIKAMQNKKLTNQDLVNILEKDYGIKVTLDTIKSYRRKGGKNASPDDKKLAIIAKILNVSTDYLMGMEDSIPLKPIPLIGIASCGVPSHAYDDIVEYVYVPEKFARDGVYAVRAVGDSMEPRIYEGDVVVCDIYADIKNGDIVHYTTEDGESGIKRYKITPDDIVTLYPINQESEATPLIEDKNFFRLARAIRLIQDL